jgi:hypothetical protein
MGDVRLSDNDVDVARRDHDSSSVIDFLAHGQPHSDCFAAPAASTLPSTTLPPAGPCGAAAADTGYWARAGDLVRIIGDVGQPAPGHPRL